MARALLTVVASGVALGLVACQPSKPAPAAPSSQDQKIAPADPAPTLEAAPSARETSRLNARVAEFHRGAALLEQYRYADAAEAFRKVLAESPDWKAARFNLGLALLNQQGQAGAETALDDAKKAFQAILATDPDHLPARFALGLCLQHTGDVEPAMEQFEIVHQADPADPYVAYKYAETLGALDRHEAAIPVFEKIVADSPGFTSAIYRLMMEYQRAGRSDEARALSKRFQELRRAELHPEIFMVDKVYGGAGKYHLAMGPDDLPLDRRDATPGVSLDFDPEVTSLDAPAAELPAPPADANLPGLAVEDVDGDGDLDLCLACPAPHAAAQLWRNDGSGHFAPGPAFGEQVTSPCFGDVDNDGTLDLWLGRTGEGQLLLGDGKGAFAPSSLVVGSADTLTTASARLVDLDSDGDLDFLACRTGGRVPPPAGAAPAAILALNNNRDGTVADMAGALGLGDPLVASAVVYDDFDGDRDLDLIVFSADDREPVAWVNDRVERYHILPPDVAGLHARAVRSATSGDPDKDGDQDLLVSTRESLQLWLNDGTMHFAPAGGFAAAHGTLTSSGGQFADLDNDGDLDILLPDAPRTSGKPGPCVLVNRWPEQAFVNLVETQPQNLLAGIELSGPASAVAAEFTGDGRPDIFLLPRGGKPLLLRGWPGKERWVGLRLEGTVTTDQKTRSNRSAIGAQVEVHAGATWQRMLVGAPAGPVAMPPLRLHLGLGSSPTVDWLRVIWPDGVLQAELELPGGQVHPLVELQRKISSCPNLFAWNGRQFEFVSDFGGMGGLGFLAGLREGAEPPAQRLVFVPPDPTEYVPLPAIEPLDGYYVLQAMEPLEEVVYFDEAKLLAVDHPAGTRVLPRELAAVEVEPPPFELFCFGEPIEPETAQNHRGADVTELLRTVDRRYAGATELDEQFVGYAREHFVDLDFGDRLASLAPSDRLILCVQGWVEYSYSSTNYSAAQAGKRLAAPSLAAWRDGRWVELLHEAGYPAGLQHWMTLDVTGLVLPTDRRLRLTSNMEIFYDCIHLARHQDELELAVTEVPAASADLHTLGYPREFSPDGRRPNLYDYSNIDRAEAWLWIAGAYTRFGDVTPLVGKADDCYVILGRGEEITLRFAADAFPPVPPGRQRTFLLKTDSYCKDMDLYTAHGSTVEPLPFHGMNGYPYPDSESYPDTPATRACRDAYHTRRVETRLVPPTEP